MICIQNLSLSLLVLLPNVTFKNVLVFTPLDNPLIHLVSVSGNIIVFPTINRSFSSGIKIHVYHKNRNHLDVVKITFTLYLNKGALASKNGNRMANSCRESDS